MIRSIVILIILMTSGCLVPNAHGTSYIMYPNFSLNDRGFFWAGPFGIHRGDFIVYTPPLPPPYSRSGFANRVIGLPGEIVSMVSVPVKTEGMVLLIPTVSVNGSYPRFTIRKQLHDHVIIEEEILGEAHLISRSFQYRKPPPEVTVHLNADEYFLMVDNRDFPERKASHDFGPVKKNSIIWKHMLTYWHSGSIPPAEPTYPDP